MPRNSSGTMSALNGPYVTGTVISSSVVDARLADIETEITDSLDRSAKGGMLNVLALQSAGSGASAPDLTWTGDLTTGLYRIGAGDIAFAIAGTKLLEMSASSVAITGTMTASGGASASGVIGKAGSGGTKPGVIGLGTSATAQALSQSPGVYARGAANSNSIYADFPTTGNAAILANGDGAAGLQVQISNNNSLGVAAHINLVPLTATPTLHADGDLWIENVSGTWHFKVRMNGITSTIV